MSITPSDSFSGGAKPDSIDTAWRDAWTPPDRRQIYEWARDYVDLQGDYANKGPFVVDSSRYLILPFQLLANDQVRMINVLKAVQTFGSGIGDIFLQWIFANAPGPSMYTFQSDDDAEQHYLTRIKTTFEASTINRSLFSRLHKKRDLYQFPHLNVYFQGANHNSLQRKSIQYEVNDEVWCWNPGMLAEAWARTEAFRRICKIINISQGGTVDSDWETACNNGRRYEWSCRCRSCNHLQPLTFFGRMEADPKIRAAIVWDDDARRADGSWDKARASASARFRCSRCGHEHADEPRTWDYFNTTGDYLLTDHDRPLRECTLRWTSLVRGGYSDLVNEFLTATDLQKQGSTAALERFYQKKLGLFWDPAMGVEKIVLETHGFLKEAPLVPGYKAAQIDGEARRFITADYQQGTGNEGRHLVVTARAWKNKGASRLLWQGKLRTFEQLRELQLALGVADPAVCVDGGFELMEVASYCARYGWTVLCGADEETFSHAAPKGKRNAKPRRRPFSPRKWIDPYKGRAGQGRAGAWCFYWSNPSVKNILWRLRHGLGPSWELPADVDAEYRDQIDSELKKRFLNKSTGAVEHRWVQYKAANHYWDCECMQLVCALIAGFIEFDFDELDAGVRAKGSFDSTAPEGVEEVNPRTTSAPASVPSPIAPHAQPEQLTLLSA